MSHGDFYPGERLVLSFKGPDLPRYMRFLLEEGMCGGIIFFSDNFVSPSQIKSLTEEIKERSIFNPPFLMVDQEGGRVQRFKKPLPEAPPAMEIAASCEKDAGLCHRSGKLMGRHLKYIGINMNLAPVLDVLTDPGNRVIGDRSFGMTGEKASTHGMEFAKGLIDSGICPVVKHFPGHGMTLEDSHEMLPATGISPEELKKTHIYPFKNAIAAGIPALMTAHVVYENLDPGYPATLSRKIIKNLLRGSLKFAGTVISDDLNMKAISSKFSPPEVAARSTEASVDLLLHCGPRDDQEKLAAQVKRLYSDRKADEADTGAIHERLARLRVLISGNLHDLSSGDLNPSP